ncbi:MAG: polysaccharide pyruvyl transferase family protein [Candidatus Desulfofervidus auxilii]|nr:polysaccharide pyruvyl transferase family protein [Candidatus Desulfofervidus auxilii]
MEYIDSMKNIQIKKRHQILYSDDFKTLKKVLIIGNYGPGNFGDEVMLDVILDLLSKECKVYIPTRSPETLKELHPDSRIIPLYFKNIWYILKEAIKCDAIIFGGGTIFTKGRGIGIDLTLILSLLLKLSIKKKIYFYGIGYSETTPLGLRILAKLLMQNGNVFVRDKKSKDLILKKVGINPCLIKDLTFYWKPPKAKLPPEIKKIIIENNNAIIVGLSITKDLFEFKKEKEFVKFLNYITSKYNILIFAFIFNPEFRGRTIGLSSDLYLYKKIKEELYKNIKFYILPYYPPHVLFEVVKHVDIIIGMRYHSLILAHLHSKHIIGIAVFDKQETFLVEHNYPYIRLNKLTSGDLIRIFEKVLSTIKSDQK